MMQESEWTNALNTGPSSEASKSTASSTRAHRVPHTRLGNSSQLSHQGERNGARDCWCILSPVSYSG